MCEVIVSQANDGMGTSVSIMCLPISLLSIQIDLFHLACPVKRQLCRSELSLHIYACTLELCNCSEQQQHPEMEYCIRSGFSGFFFYLWKRNVFFFSFRFMLGGHSVCAASTQTNLPLSLLLSNSHNKVCLFRKYEAVHMLQK